MSLILREFVGNMVSRSVSMGLKSIPSSYRMLMLHVAAGHRLGQNLPVIYADGAGVHGDRGETMEVGHPSDVQCGYGTTSQEQQRKIH